MQPAYVTASGTAQPAVLTAAGTAQPAAAGGDKPIFCGECGAKNPKGTKFCGECGKPVA